MCVFSGTNSFLSFVKCSGHQMAGDSIHSLEGSFLYVFLSFFLKRRITIEVRVFFSGWLYVCFIGAFL